MLRTITELVPFGQDDYARRISAMYLANVGNNGSECDYIIAYFETPSKFSPDGVCSFKYIKGYDRNQPLFNMLKEIYDKDGWCTDDQILEQCGDTVPNCVRVINIFYSRAKSDLKWDASK